MSKMLRAHASVPILACGSNRVIHVLLVFPLSQIRTPEVCVEDLVDSLNTGPIILNSKTRNVYKEASSGCVRSLDRCPWATAAEQKPPSRTGASPPERRRPPQPLRDSPPWAALCARPRRPPYVASFPNCSKNA